jgi:hypothetical protein
MRSTVKTCGLAAAILIGLAHVPAEGAFQGLPRSLKNQVETLRLNQIVVPADFTQFCSADFAAARRSNSSVDLLTADFEFAALTDERA